MSLDYPGPYSAWLSDSLGNSPATNFTQSNTPYVTPDPLLTHVAENWADSSADHSKPRSNS